MKLQNVDYIRTETPLGVFLLAARGDALKGGWFVGQKYFPDISAETGWRECETPILQEAAVQLQDYFNGTRTAFDVPLALEGTSFQQAVWQALAAVPCGQTTSYGELARRIGKPGSFHPVGAAVGHNPLSIIIPCHRALGSDGSLTGYAGGLQRKRWLLEHESPQASLFA